MFCTGDVKLSRMVQPNAVLDSHQELTFDAHELSAEFIAPDGERSEQATQRMFWKWKYFPALAINASVR